MWQIPKILRTIVDLPELQKQKGPEITKQYKTRTFCVVMLGIDIEFPLDYSCRTLRQQTD